jgi:hypothetical protein
MFFKYPIICSLVYCYSNHSLTPPRALLNSNIFMHLQTTQIMSSSTQRIFPSSNYSNHAPFNSNMSLQISKHSNQIIFKSNVRFAPSNHSVQVFLNFNDLQHPQICTVILNQLISTLNCIKYAIKYLKHSNQHLHLPNVHLYTYSVLKSPNPKHQPMLQTCTNSPPTQSTPNAPPNTKNTQGPLSYQLAIKSLTPQLVRVGP